MRMALFTRFTKCLKGGILHVVDPGGGVGQGLFAESAMIMCTGFNCIPCTQKTALSSVLATSAQKRPFYKLSPDTVQDVFYVLSLGPHFCHPIPSFDKSTGDGRGLITL